MNIGPKYLAARRTAARSTMPGLPAALLIAALAVMLFPATARSHPQTRDGFYIGLGMASGSAAVDFGGNNDDRETGYAGSFRFGWTVNPKFALGLESNSWVKVNDEAAASIGSVTVAGSFFPAEGLVLRGGLGGGYLGEADEGLGGSGGFAYSLGATYEFRVLRTLAIGPQIDYTHVSLENDASANFYNFGLALNWYFIPK